MGGDGGRETLGCSVWGVPCLVNRNRVPPWTWTCSGFWLCLSTSRDTALHEPFLESH